MKCCITNFCNSIEDAISINNDSKLKHDSVGQNMNEKYKIKFYVNMLAFN